jgi:hypothetical protein
MTEIGRSAEPALGTAVAFARRVPFFSVILAVTFEKLPRRGYRFGASGADSTNAGRALLDRDEVGLVGGPERRVAPNREEAVKNNAEGGGASNGKNGLKALCHRHRTFSNTWKISGKSV